MRTRTLLLIVAVAATVVAAGGAGAAEDPVAAENDSSYEVGTTLAFDVDDGDATYELRTDDGLLVAQFQAADGTVVVDTGSLDPGSYVLEHAGSHAVAYEFALTPGDTPTAAPTTTPSLTPTAPPPSTATQSPTPAQVDTPTPVPAENGTTYETGTRLSFDVDGGTYELRADSGVLVAQLQAQNGTVVVDTAMLDPGTYRLLDADSGETTAEFAVTDDGTAPGSTRTATGTGSSTEPSASPTMVTGSTTSPDSHDLSTETPPGTPTTVPGFGVAATLAAGLVALLLAAARNR